MHRSWFKGCSRLCSKTEESRKSQRDEATGNQEILIDSSSAFSLALWSIQPCHNNLFILSKSFYNAIHNKNYGQKMSQTLWSVISVELVYLSNE